MVASILEISLANIISRQAPRKQVNRTTGCNSSLRTHFCFTMTLKKTINVAPVAPPRNFTAYSFRERSLGNEAPKIRSDGSNFHEWHARITATAMLYGILNFLTKSPITAGDINSCLKLFVLFHENVDPVLYLCCDPSSLSATWNNIKLLGRQVLKLKWHSKLSLLISLQVTPTHSFKNISNCNKEFLYNSKERIPFRDE